MIRQERDLAAKRKLKAYLDGKVWGILQGKGKRGD
jgi:hypothetical protein